jgi:hypothetical protein
LARRHLTDGVLVLYDVTSTYFEYQASRALDYDDISP